MEYEALLTGSGTLLAGLDREQLAAVTAPLGEPALVVAGPGSGKTHVIAARVAWMIAMGADPQSIAAFTFTNKAAAELRQRIAQTLRGAAGDDPVAQNEAAAAANLVYAGTFHAFGARFLRDHADRAGVSSRFTIYDRDDTNSLLNRMLRNLRQEADRDAGSGAGAYDPKALAEIHNAKLGRYISLQKNAGHGPDAVCAAAPDDLHARLYARYQESLDQAQGLDFNDLVLLPIRMMERDPGILASVRAQFRHVLVDEYQDTNPNQARLARLLAGDGPDASLYVVGDPDQSIYSFQHASVDNILEFARSEFPDAPVYHLVNNYRSQEHIVAAANRLIRRNSRRIARESATVRAPALPVQVLPCADENAEANAVIRRIKSLKDAGKTDYEDWCVAYRTNAQSQPLEAACLAQGVPYRVRGGFEFYKRAEVAVAVSYLRLALNRDDTVALDHILNVPRRGIGAAARQRLEEHAAVHDLHPRDALRDLADGVIDQNAGPDSKPFQERTKAGARQLLNVVAELRAAAGDPENAAAAVMGALLHGGCGLEEYCRTSPGDGENRWSNLNRLHDMARTHPGSLAEFCDQLRLNQREEPEPAAGSDAGSDAAPAPRLTLSTLHQTKGLEWPNVHIAGVVNGYVPHLMAKTAAEREEERRLFYVGCTRAQDRLYISHPLRRSGGESARRQQRSPFIGELLPPAAK